MSEEVPIPLLKMKSAENPKQSLVKAKKAEDTDQYLSLDQLLPLDKAEVEIKATLENLKSLDWSRQFDACNTLRRACVHHVSILNSKTPAQIHGMILDMIKIAESLRSSLVKNCILTLTGKLITQLDLIRALKRGLDLELDSIVAMALKKGGETGSFIALKVNDLLTAICEVCSENRVSGAFLSAMGITKNTFGVNPSPSAKFKTVAFLEKLINRLGNKFTSFKDAEKIISLLSAYLSEGSLEVRNATKQAIITASTVSGSPIEFDRLLQRTLDTASYAKFKSVIAKGLTGSPTSPSKHVLSNKRLRKPILTPEQIEEVKKSPQNNESKKLVSPSTRRKPLEEPSEFESIPTLTATITNSNNWRTRVEAIDSLENIALKYTEQLKLSGKFILVLDSFVKLLNDTNVKVSLRAVNVFEKFIPLFKTNLEQNVHLMLESLASNLCSTNVALKNKSDVLIDLLVETLEALSLLQPFVHVIVYGNSRAKTIMIQHLGDILPDVHKQKPILIQKHVLPEVFKLLDDSKIEVKLAVNKLIQTLYDLLGKELLDSTPQQKLPRILEAVKP